MALRTGGQILSDIPDNPSFLNKLKILYRICPLKWRVGFANENDVLHHALHAAPLSDGDARLPHVVNPGENRSESVVAVLDVGVLSPL